MPVILTVFFYLDGCFAFTSLNAADDSLFWSRCKVQIPTIMSVINRRNAGNKFINHFAVFQFAAVSAMTEAISTSKTA